MLADNTDLAPRSRKEQCGRAICRIRPSKRLTWLKAARLPSLRESTSLRLSERNFARKMSDWIFFGTKGGEIAASVLVELTLALREKDDNERLIACALRHVAWMEETTN